MTIQGQRKACLDFPALSTPSHLEGHPSGCKWLITMVIVSPLSGWGCYTPLPDGLSLFMTCIWGGGDPITTCGWMIHPQPATQDVHPLQCEDRWLWHCCPDDLSLDGVSWVQKVHQLEMEPNNHEGCRVTPLKTHMTGWKITNFNRRYIFQMANFSMVVLVFRGVFSL